MEYIGERCFSDCAIQTIRLPPTLKRLEAGTFKNCKHLESIKIPSGVEFIGNECFDGTRVKKLTLPSTLKESGIGAFKGLARLKVI